MVSQSSQTEYFQAGGEIFVFYEILRHCFTVLHIAEVTGSYGPNYQFRLQFMMISVLRLVPLAEQPPGLGGGQAGQAVAGPGGGAGGGGGARGAAVGPAGLLCFPRPPARHSLHPYWWCWQVQTDWVAPGPRLGRPANRWADNRQLTQHIIY